MEPGTRVTYDNGRPGTPIFSGTVRAGGCSDSTCTYVHVDCDNGSLHHVEPSSLRPEVIAPNT